jgi:general secretion pathway protein N
MADHSPSPWRWAAGGALAGWLAATLWFAPAQWAATWLLKASGGQLLLTGTSGSIWSGSAQFSLASGYSSQSSVALPGRLVWVVSPGWRSWKLQIHAACCMDVPLVATISPGLGGLAVKIDDHQSHWPAGLLVGLGTPWNTVQAEGQLVFSLQGLSLEWPGWSDSRMVMVGQLQLDALDLTSRLSTIQPMGSYRLNVQGGKVNTLQLETLQGSLRLAGSGQWVGGRLRFEGVASALAERQDALNNLLNIIGRRDGLRSIIKLG